MRLIVVRHFKTLINAWDQIMGWGDAPPVDGWEADLQYVDSMLWERHVHIDYIYSSYLERARQTAMFYARRRGIHLIRDSDRLNEINYGTLYRKEKKWVEDNIPEHKKDPDFVYPGGESFSQMQKRSVAFTLSIENVAGDKTVLLVVHAGVVRALVCHFLGLEYASNLRRKISHCYTGDFLVHEGRCCGYDELGKLSGFVKDGVVTIPWGDHPAHQADQHKLPPLAAGQE